MPLQSPSRRTVLRSAAWSVPVVATAAAVPAFAASPTCVNTPRELNNFGVAVAGLSATNTWTNSTTITNTVGPAPTAPAFGISAATTLTYVVQAYSITVTYPYDVAFGAAPTGYTITRVKNGTTPNATYSFTFTALGSVLGGTYSSTTANPPTAGFVIPTFTGATTNAQAKADGYVANGSSGSTPVPLSVSRSATYQILTPGQCATAPQTFTTTPSFSLTPTTP